MTTKPRRFIALITLLSLAVGLIGCSQSENDGAKSEKKSGPVTITVAWWGKDTRHKRTLEVIEMFEKKYPDIKVKAEYGSIDDYWTKLAMDTADKKIPDVIQLDYDHLGQYASRQLIEPLDSYTKKGPLHLEDVDNALLVSGKLKNKLFGISLGTNAASTAYNPAVFDQAGIPYPKSDYTYDDLTEVARQLKQKLGADFYPLANNVAFNFGYYLRQNGQSYYSKDGTSLGYTDDKYFINFVNMELLWKKEGLMPDSAKKDLNDGKSAFFSTWSNQVAKLVEDGAIGLLPLPSVSGGQEGNYLRPSQLFSVASYSKNKEAAVKFIDYITNDLEANQVLKGERGVPISSKVRDKVASLVNGNEKVQYSYLDEVEKHSRPIDPPAPNAGSKIDSTFKLYEAKALTGELTPESAAKLFREEANQILSSTKQ